MAHARLVAVLAAGALLVSAWPAHATWPVLDEAAVAKMTEQIKQAKKDFANQIEQLEKLKEQVSFLTDIRDFISDVSDAIGEIATIVLPITSIESISAQLVRDTVCLMPDGVSWGIELDDLDLATICDLSSKYRRALFVDKDELGSSTLAEQNAKRQEVAARRDALLADVTSRSLAQGDKQIQQAKEINSTATELQSAANGAKTMQKRLAVSNQIMIAQLRADAERNQILAQMLKLQAAVALKAGLGADDFVSSEDDEEGGD